MTAWDLKPRTVGELLDAAFYVYRRQFGRLVLVSLLLSLPTLVFATLNADVAAKFAVDFVDWFQGAMRHPNGDVQHVLGDEMRLLSQIQPLALASGAFQSFARSATIACMAVAGSAALRREKAPPLGAMLRAAAPRFPAALVAQVLVDQFVGIGAVCCIVPGVLVAVMAAPIIPAIVLERGPAESALRRSVPAALRWPLLPFAELVDGLMRALRLSAHGPSLARGTIYLFFLFMFVGIANSSAAALATIFVSKTSGWFWAQHYAEALFLPAWGLGLSFWYSDLRVRREGLDLATAS